MSDDIDEEYEAESGHERNLGRILALEMLLTAVIVETLKSGALEEATMKEIFSAAENAFVSTDDFTSHEKDTGKFTISKIRDSIFPSTIKLN